MTPMVALSPSFAASLETTRMADALNALAACATGTDAACERMGMALAASRLALSATVPMAADAAVLCLDRDVTESYSIEEAREKAGCRPRHDLLAAGLELPAKPSL